MIKKTNSKKSDVLNFFLFIIGFVVVFLVINELLKKVVVAPLAYIVSTVLFFLSIKPAYNYFSKKIIKK